MYDAFTGSGDGDVGMFGGAVIILPITEHVPGGKCLDRGEVEKDPHGSPEKERLGCVALTSRPSSTLTRLPAPKV